MNTENKKINTFKLICRRAEQSYYVCTTNIGECGEIQEYELGHIFIDQTDPKKRWVSRTRNPETGSYHINEKTLHEYQSRRHSSNEFRT